MGLSYQQLVDELLSHLGADEEDFATATQTGAQVIALLINRSWWQIMDEFDFREKESSDTFNTVAGTASYDVSSSVSPIIFDALQKVVITDDENQNYVIDPISLDRYNREYNSNTSLRAIPEKYYRREGELVLYPTPDQAYVVTLYFWNILSDLSGSYNPPVPQSWHEIVLQGAVWRGYQRLGDYNRSRQAKAHQAELVISATSVSAKEKSDMPYAGLTVLGRDY